jgi:SAM-dependent methyltransferase
MTTDAAGLAESFWEPHYRAHERLFSGNANPILVEVAGSMTPGSALDLGCGEGGDAIWLAQQGWRVTAVDVSATALARGARHAVEAGVADRIDWQQHDLTRSVPTGEFDLISAQYLQSPVDFPREQALRSAAATAAVTGVLLIVDHASVAPWSWADPDTAFPTPAQLLASLELPGGQWHPDRLDTPSRLATGPDGQTATVLDNVVAMRRVFLGGDRSSS